MRRALKSAVSPDPNAGLATGTGGTHSPFTGVIQFLGNTPTVTTTGITVVRPSSGEIRFTGNVPTVVAVGSTEVFPQTGIMRFKGVGGIAAPQTAFPQTGVMQVKGLVPGAHGGITAQPQTGRIQFRGNTPIVGEPSDAPYDLGILPSWSNVPWPDNPVITREVTVSTVSALNTEIASAGVHVWVTAGTYTGNVVVSASDVWVTCEDGVVIEDGHLDFGLDTGPTSPAADRVKWEGGKVAK